MISQESGCSHGRGDLTDDPIHDSTTLAQKVYLQLRANILTGRIAPGESVTIRGLAEDLQVSAMPVREALRRLISERALEMQDNRRVRIPHMSIERFEELLDARVTLETEAAERALPYIDAERVARLREIDRALMLAASAANLGLWMDLNFQFHSCIYEARPQSALLPLIESLWLQIAPFMRRALMELDGHYAEDRHLEALKAIQAKNRIGLRIAIEADIRDGIGHIGNQLIESDTRRLLAVGSTIRRKRGISADLVPVL